MFPEPIASNVPPTESTNPPGPSILALELGIAIGLRLLS